MRKQELFNRALMGVRAQGGPATKTIHGELGCAYRGRNGARCGVGHIIEDRHYKRKLEGLPADHDDVREAMKASGVLPRQFEFMTALQKAHDNAVDEFLPPKRRSANFMPRFEDNMAALAATHGLRYAAPSA